MKEQRKNKEERKKKEIKREKRLKGEKEANNKIRGCSCGRPERERESQSAFI